MEPMLKPGWNGERPRTYAGAVNTLFTYLDQTTMLQITQGRLKATDVHHSLGQALRNEWGLLQPESTLALDMYAKFGLKHPDDLSTLIIENTWANVRNIPYDVVGRAKTLHEYWLEDEAAHRELHRPTGYFWIALGMFILALMILLVYPKS